jgi:hypothetical protein
VELYPNLALRWVPRISEPLAKHQQNIMISELKSDTLHGTVGTENAIHQLPASLSAMQTTKLTMRVLTDRAK